MQGYALEKGAIRCYQAVGTTDISTASSSYVDMADMSITFTLKQKKDVVIFFNAPIRSTVAVGMFVELQVDSVSKDVTERLNNTSYFTLQTSMCWKENLTAGSHTVNIRWKTDGGTATQGGSVGNRTLQVLELGAEQEAPSSIDYVSMLHVADERSSGTAGDSLSATNYVTRTLNTVKTNTISGASVASNTITLPAGTYFFDVTAQASDCGSNHIRLRNTTDSSTALMGSTGWVGYPGAHSSITAPSILMGQVTITSPKSFQIQHYCKEYSGTGGVPSTDGTEKEIYLNVIIRKIGADSSTPSLVTSLNGLGGMYRNLSVIRPTASTVTVGADKLNVESETEVVTLTSVTVTADITSSGANGIDSGSEASATWYYVWVIYNGTTTAALLSTSATNPTMPSGYTYKALVSAVRNDGSSNFVDFRHEGMEYWYSSWQQIVTAGSTNYWTSLDISSFVPSAISTVIRGSIESGGGNGIVAVSNVNTGGDYTDTNEPNVIKTVGDKYDVRQFELNVITESTIYWGNRPSNTSWVFCSGFKINKL